MLLPVNLIKTQFLKQFYMIYRPTRRMLRPVVVMPVVVMPYCKQSWCICTCMERGSGGVLESPPKRARHFQCVLASKTSEQLFRLKKFYYIFHGDSKTYNKIKIG